MDERPQWLTELIEYEKAGIRVSINDYKTGATAEEKLSDFIRERGCYMPDFITDDQGVLREVRYDRIL